MATADTRSVGLPLRDFLISLAHRQAKDAPLCRAKVNATHDCTHDHGPERGGVWGKVECISEARAKERISSVCEEVDGHPVFISARVNIYYPDVGLEDAIFVPHQSEACRHQLHESIVCVLQFCSLWPCERERLRSNAEFREYLRGIPMPTSHHPLS